MDQKERNYLKEAREKAGISKTEMARKLEIPIRTIEDWEAGRRKPPEYVKRLVIRELKRIELNGGNEMNKIVEKAKEMDQFGNNIPDVEQGGK